MLFSAELAACLLFRHTTAQENGGRAAYMRCYYKNTMRFKQTNLTLGS